MLLAAAAENGRRGRKREIVLLEKWGLLSLTEIIVLRRILQGKVTVERVCDRVAFIRAAERVHLSLLHHLHLELGDVSLLGTTSGILFLPGCSFFFFRFYSLG